MDSYINVMHFGFSDGRIEGDDIENLLRKGHMEQGFVKWKALDFEFLSGLSAASNFYYLRQAILYRESKKPGKTSIDLRVSRPAHSEIDQAKLEDQELHIKYLENKLRLITDIEISDNEYIGSANRSDFLETLKAKVTENLKFVEQELIAGLKADLKEAKYQKILVELQLEKVASELNFYKETPKKSSTPMRNKRANSNYNPSETLDLYETDSKKVSNLNKIIKKCQILLNEKITESCKLEKEHQSIVNSLEKNLFREKFEKELMMRKESDQSAISIKNEHLELTVGKLEKENQELYEENCNMIESLEKANAQKKELESELTNRIIEFEEEIDRLLKQKESELDVIQADFRSNEQKYQMEIEKKHLEMITNIRRLEDTIMQLKAENKAAAEENAGWKKKIRSYEASNKDLQKQIENLNNLLSESTAESKEYIDNLAILQQDYEICSKELECQIEASESLKQLFEKFRQESITKLQEASKAVEICKNEAIDKQCEIEELQKSISRLEKVEKVSQELIDKLRLTKKTLKASNSSTAESNADLLNKLSVYEAQLNSLENKLRSEYSSLCRTYGVTPKDLTTLDSYLIEIFEIFPSRYQDEVTQMNQMIQTLSKKLEAQLSSSIQREENLHSTSEHQEYLDSQITYLEEVNKELKNELESAKDMLSTFLELEFENLSEAIERVTGDFETMFHENKRFVQIIDELTAKNVQLVDSRNSAFEESNKCQQEVEDIKKELEETKGERGLSEEMQKELKDEISNLQTLLQDYKKIRAELEQKTANLTQALTEAVRVRDILAEELSEKCDIIENYCNYRS